MYENLEKYFAKPHEGSIFTERGESNVYEVLSKVTKSTIHIFWLIHSTFLDDFDMKWCKVLSGFVHLSQQLK